MRNLNLEHVEEADDFTRVPAGGYICKITKVTDVTGKEYLKIEYEIMEGPHKGSSERTFKAAGFWPNFIKSYKEKALPYFKGMVTAVEQSNQGYKWDNDERKLVGNCAGLVMGEEEYMAKGGKIKTRLYVAHIRSCQKIRNGDYEVPALKKMAQQMSQQGYGQYEYAAQPESENPAYGCEAPF